MTFASDIEETAAEPIEAVVIGPFGWGDADAGPGTAFGEDRISIIVPAEKRGVVLTWEDARPLLDYEYDRGYGAAECHAVYVWTANKVLWVTQHAGATGLDSAPRNPLDLMPRMSCG